MRTTEPRRDDRAAAIEQAAITLARGDGRVLGVLGLGPGSGAEAFAVELARVWRDGGRNALVVDLTRAALPTEAVTACSPEEAARAPFAANMDGAPILLVRPPAERRLAFQDAGRLAGLFDALAGYDPLVVLPARADDRGRDVINPFAVAAACDAVLLVCDRGRTTRSSLRSRARPRPGGARPDRRRRDRRGGPSVAGRGHLRARRSAVLVRAAPRPRSSRGRRAVGRPELKRTSTSSRPVPKAP